ncbi:MAG: efflux RND transporter periplasmic adaptor subunit [Marinosulfonomonas sp.]
MRLFSIITALLVMGALYLLVFEREKLMSYVGSQTLVPAAETAQAEPEEAADPQMAEAEPETAPEGIARVSVVAMTSEATDITNAVLVRGRTEAARQVDVRSETTGLVISTPLRKGQVVEQGQMLCKLDPGTRDIALLEAQARLPEAKSRVPEAAARLPEAQARLEEALSRVEESQINLTAANKLAEGGFASDTRVASAKAANSAALAAVQTATAGLETAKAGVQSAQSGILAAEAGIAAAEKEISRLTIRAPFSGFLEADTAENGSLLQPGALCSTIIQLDPIKLVGYISESDVDRVTVGSIAGARLATGQEVQGKVTFLSRSSDEATRTFRVEIQVPNPDAHIRDGQTVEIIIASEGEVAHLLPQSSLTLDNEGNLGVRIVDENNIAKFVEVQVVRDSVDGIWVTGLAPTVDVIVVGQEYVIDGVPVDVTYQKEAS